jgi:hypothetical protein
MSHFCTLPEHLIYKEVYYLALEAGRLHHFTSEDISSRAGGVFKC